MATKLIDQHGALGGKASSEIIVAQPSLVAVSCGVSTPFKDLPVGLTVPYRDRGTQTRNNTTLHAFGKIGNGGDTNNRHDDEDHDAYPRSCAVHAGSSTSNSLRSTPHVDSDLSWMSPDTEALNIVTAGPAFMSSPARERRLLLIFCLEVICVLVFLLICGIVDMASSSR